MIPPGLRGGVHVSVGDVDADGQEKVLVTPWSGVGPQVRVLSR